MSKIIDSLEHPTLKQAAEENHKTVIDYLGYIFTARFYHELSATWWLTPVGFNLLTHTPLTPETPESEIDRVLQYISMSSTTPIRWHVGPSTRHARLEHRLQANGWSKEIGDPVMALDIDNLLDTHLEVPTGLTIQLVEDDETYNRYIDTMSAGFEFPEALTTYLSNADHVRPDPAIRHYLGFFEGKPVAISLLYRSAGLAGIYNIAVIPQMRHRGIGKAMTLATLLDARDLGYHVAILAASEQGIPLYRRLGFQDIFTFDVYTSPAVQS
jgi:ribosomal protein S18 acetylase RimI-like enzyme